MTGEEEKAMILHAQRTSASVGVACAGSLRFLGEWGNEVELRGDDGYGAGLGLYDGRWVGFI